jgi:hypothetical protein
VRHERGRDKETDCTRLLANCVSSVYVDGTAGCLDLVVKVRGGGSAKQYRINIGSVTIVEGMGNHQYPQEIRIRNHDDSK